MKLKVAHLLVDCGTKSEVVDEHNGRLTDSFEETVVEKVSLYELEVLMLLAVPAHPTPELALHYLSVERVDEHKKKLKCKWKLIRHLCTVCRILCFLDAVTLSTWSRCCRLKNYLTNT